MLKDEIGGAGWSRLQAIQGWFCSTWEAPSVIQNLNFKIKLSLRFGLEKQERAVFFLGQKLLSMSLETGLYTHPWPNHYQCLFPFPPSLLFHSCFKSKVITCQDSKLTQTIINLILMIVKSLSTKHKLT